MLYYKSIGSGKTIVFIHGISQSTEIWKDLVREPLLTSYHSILVDLPGHGQSFRSTCPTKDYTLKGLAAHLTDFLLSFDNYIIVTSSLAGNFVAEIIQQTKNCKGLFLIGASVIGGKITVPEIVKPNPYFEVSFMAYPTDGVLEGLIDTLTIGTNNTSKRDFIKMFRNTDPTLRTQLGTAIAQADWTDEVANLEQLEYPVAMVYGADEKLISPSYLNKTDIKMWRNGIIEVPDAGHYCQFDQPAQLASLISQYASDAFKATDS